MNQILAELAKERGVADLYREWNRINREKLSRLRGQVDGKLKAKIEQKKAAHGLKTDPDIPQPGNEDEETEDRGLIL